jgi:ABC-type Fe3+-hydroxamate transport system substrate-binding protein
VNRRFAGVLSALAVLLSGCASVGDRADSAQSTAVRFLRDVADGAGDAACTALAPNTLAELEKSEQKPCREAILGEDLPAPGEAGKTLVYGQWAQVKLTGDTVFLATFPGGWRVIAAGCTPRGDRPYDCTLQGS